MVPALIASSTRHRVDSPCRAAQCYYLQRICFGERVRSRTFGTAPLSHPRINLIRMEEELSEVHLRLVQVVIENLTWQDFIKRYDKPGALFYLDPPYYKAPFYAHNLELNDYHEMAEVLKGIKSSFILSINDHPEMRKVFKGFTVHPVDLKYSVAKNNQKIAKELLIS